MDEDIFESFRKIINSSDNSSIRNQMSLFCNSLEKRLNEGSYLNEMPSISLQIESDEVFIEWIFEGFRLGFLFCDNPNESGWNIVASTPGGVHSSSTKFNGDILSSTSKIAEHIAGIA